MTAPSADWSRQDWKYKAPAQAFREAHGNPLYTMVFHGRLKRKMERKNLPVVMRVDALIDRMANGNLSDCVVDAMPRVYDADPIPRKLTQVEIAVRLGVSTAAVSGACKLLREESLVMPDPGDGSISPNQCVDGELFEAAQRAGSPNLLLNAPQDDDGLPKFADFKAQWLSQHPDHVAAKAHLIQERENLRAQVRDVSADIHDLELMELAAYRAVCRKMESERRNSAAHSTNGTGANVYGEQNHSGAAGAPDSGGVDTLPVETVQDSTFENGPKPRVFNETAKESLKVEEVASSSSGVSATDSATTTTVQTPPPPRKQRRVTPQQRQTVSQLPHRHRLRKALPAWSSTGHCRRPSGQRASPFRRPRSLPFVTPLSVVMRPNS